MELVLQGRQEGAEDVHHEGFGSGEFTPDLAVNNGVKGQRPRPVELPRLVDLLNRLLGFAHGIDVGKGDLLELDAVELGQEAVAKGFGGNAGAVGDEEGGAFHGAWGSLLIFRYPRPIRSVCEPAPCNGGDNPAGYSMIRGLCRARGAPGDRQ